MDVIARLPGCFGQAADAISAHTQVKMEDTPRLLQITKSECPYIYICMDRFSTTQVPKIMEKIEVPVVPLERNLCGHPLAGLLW